MNEVIILLCVLLLIAYFFDVSSKYTRIPSAIMLIALGWLVEQLFIYYKIPLPDLQRVLPALGTVGLILIVLEGSLELEFNASKYVLIRKSTLLAIIPLFVLAFILAFLFMYYAQVGLKAALANAIPLCVISSAIAIPSVNRLSSHHREFVIYETSISDIIGVIFFNFIVLNEYISGISFGYFLLEIVAMLIISFLASAGLSFLLSRLNHHIRFVPIILLVLLIYAVSKVLHLPALLFILLFGLFLGNLDEFKQYKWIQKLEPDKLNKEVHQFKEFAAEATFMIRAMFFISFGFILKTSEILNPTTFAWAFLIMLLVLLIRFVSLKLLKISIKPLLFVAPRGLITVLLFVSVPETQKIFLINSSLIIQIILLSALVMVFGLVFNRQVN